MFAVMPHKLLIVSMILAALLTVRDSYADTLRLASGSWEPFTSEQQPQYQVIENIVINAFEAAGHQVELVYYPWKRSYNMALHGEVDGTFPWFKTDNREKDFIYSDTIFRVTEVFFHRKDVSFDWQSLSDLEPYVIGTTIGYSHEEILGNAGLMFESASQEELNFKKLLHRRVDLSPSVLEAGLYILETQMSPQQAREITYHPKPFTGGTEHVLFPRSLPKSAFWNREFNRGLAILKRTGQFQPVTLADEQQLLSQP